MTIATVSGCLLLASVAFAPAAAHHVAARLVWIALGAVAVVYAACHLLGGRGKAEGKSRGRDGPTTGGDASGRLPGWAGPVPMLIVVQMRKGKARARKGG